MVTAKPPNATDVKKTESGPAEVLGGVPEPISPYARPDPDEIYRQDKQDSRTCSARRRTRSSTTNRNNKKRTVSDKISGPR
ncbi:hypothetical protein DIPPA_20256 [Diplonema papillatum]|nr:hypothetical protein DIPPA_20256 [Diplonema papillatum]